MTDLFNAWGNYEPWNSVSANLTSFGHCAVAEPVERSSKVPVWCNSTDWRGFESRPDTRHLYDQAVAYVGWQKSLQRHLLYRKKMAVLG